MTRVADVGRVPFADRWWRRLRYVAARPLGDQLLLIRAAVLLGATRVLIRTLPYSRLERLLGTRFEESPEVISPAERQQARRVAWAIRTISAHTPWTSNCFPQALTATWLLRRRGIPSTLYIGAAFDDGGGRLKAHAWSRCGGMYMTGGDGSAEFGAITSYA